MPSVQGGGGWVRALHVGCDPAPAVRESLHEHGVDLLATCRLGEAAAIIEAHGVAAVICEAPTLQGAAAIAARHVPVVVLAARDAVSDIDGITVVARHTPPPMLAEIVCREAGLIRGDGPEARPCG